MKKTIFNWMMALALVAVPMVFASCGDDDDDNKGSGGEQQQDSYVFYSFDESASNRPAVGTQEHNNLLEVKATMYKALCQSLGLQYSATQTIYVGTADDSNKVILSCDAAYEKIKDIDLGNASYKLALRMSDQTLKTYEFGEKSGLESVSFENQTLNSQLFWIGDQTGTLVPGEWGNTWTCTYTEGLVTVNTTYAEGYWSGFAISARTDTTYAEQTPDQYNNVVGKAYHGNNFLVVQQPFGNECITFAKPLTVMGFHYTNSSYTVNSILHGDNISGDKFNEQDWLKCTVTGYNGDQVTGSIDIDLASNGTYVDYWKTARLSSLGLVTKLTFSFSGSRNSSYGLNTPAYMCLDRMVLKVSAEN
jgi:hypothetical protein